METTYIFDRSQKTGENLKFDIWVTSRSIGGFVIWDEVSTGLTYQEFDAGGVPIGGKRNLTYAIDGAKTQYGGTTVLSNGNIFVSWIFDVGPTQDQPYNFISGYTIYNQMGENIYNETFQSTGSGVAQRVLDNGDGTFVLEHVLETAGIINGVYSVATEKSISLIDYSGILIGEKHTYISDTNDPTRTRHNALISGGTGQIVILNDVSADVTGVSQSERLELLYLDVLSGSIVKSVSIFEFPNGLDKDGYSKLTDGNILVWFSSAGSVYLAKYDASGAELIAPTRLNLPPEFYGRFPRFVEVSGEIVGIVAGYNETVEAVTGTLLSLDHNLIVRLDPLSLSEISIQSLDASELGADSLIIPGENGQFFYFELVSRGPSAPIFVQKSSVSELALASEGNNPSPVSFSQLVLGGFVAGQSFIVTEAELLLGVASFGGVQLKVVSVTSSGTMVSDVSTVNPDGSIDRMWEVTPREDYDYIEGQTYTQLTYLVSDGNSMVIHSARLVPERIAPVGSIFEGTTGDDQLMGTSGSDEFISNGGSDTLSGEGGFDTVVISGLYSNYAIRNDSITATTYIVGSVSSSTLKDIEELVFDDVTVSLFSNYRLREQSGSSEPYSVTAMSDGGYVLGWEEGNLVFLQRFSANGRALASPFIVSSSASGGGHSIVELADNSLLSVICDGNVFEATIVRPDGKASVIIVEEGSRNAATAIALAGGGWAIAYGDYGFLTSENFTKIKIFDQLGTIVGETSFSQENYSSVSLVELTDGSVAVAYETYLDPQARAEVSLRILDTNTFSVSEKIQVSQEFFSAHTPRLTAMSDGGLTVIFGAALAEGQAATSIYQSRFDASGVNLGSSIKVYEVGLDPDFRVYGDHQVSSFVDGGWLSVWTENLTELDGVTLSPERGVFFQRFSAIGEIVGSKVQVNIGTLSVDGVGRVAVLEDGGWIITWLSSDANGTVPYSRRYSPDGGSSIEYSLSIVGNSSDQVLVGGDGADFIDSSGGNDIVTAGAGNDFVDAGAGNDLIIGGDGAGDDVYIGGLGLDTVKYTSATAGIVVDLALGTAGSRDGGDAAGIGTDELSGIENIIAGRFNDILTGDGGDNILEGLAGDDTLDGGIGDDTAVFSGNQADYRIRYDQTAGTYTVSDRRLAADGRDTLSGIEHLAFADGTVAIGLITPDSDPADGVATGDLVVSGGAAEGGLLTASLNGLVDPDGYTTLAYRWQELVGTLWTDMAGAYQSNLAIPADQSFVGKSVRVVATSTDHYGGETDFTSATKVILNVNDAPVGAVVIQGTARQGQTLTASASVTDADGVGAFGYIWYRGNEVIDGAAAANYVLGTADVGAAITARVTYTDGFGTVETLLSAATGIVTSTSVPGVTLNGNSRANTINGTGGDDLLSGFGGNDTLNGLGGNDRLLGGDGNDTLSGGLGDDYLNGGNGTDTVTYAGQAGSVIASLATGTATGAAGNDQILNVENLIGGNGNDTLTGSDGNNNINGGSGDDFITGGKGGDTLTGGTNGSAGDTVNYADAIARVTVSLATTSAQNTGGAGRDTISGFENLVGSSFGDVLTGSTGNNVIHGGAGADRITGGDGRDYLYGGDGRDTFVFTAISNSRVGSARDVIFDLQPGDVLDFSAIDANGSARGNTAFTNIGQNAFTGIGQLRLSEAGGIWLVEGNTTGSLDADFQVELRNWIGQPLTDLVL